MAYDERTAQRVREVLSGEPHLVEKTLMGGLCFMVNGTMCCSVSARGGLLVRVDAAEREYALAQPHVEPMEMGHRTMAGFVRVLPDGYRTDATLRTWIARSLHVVATLAAEPPPVSARKKRSHRGGK